MICVCLTGILLHSPPGCAKTTLVRAVAASHQTNFLYVSAAELFSSGVGDSEKIVADLFHRARMASPCILFIDELGTKLISLHLIYLFLHLFFFGV